MLNTKDALELADLLVPFVPEEVDGDILDFIGKIVSNIGQSETPENFGLAVQLLGDLSLDEMKDMSGEKSVEIFAVGLQENKIISLVEFYQWLTT